jgi:hypothetical protein
MRTLHTLQSRRLASSDRSPTAAVRIVIQRLLGDSRAVGHKIRSAEITVVDVAGFACE